MLFSKQAKVLFSALPGHANSCCVGKSKCGWQRWITELVRAVVGFRTSMSWEDHPWKPWVSMVSSPPCSVSCPPALLLRHPQGPQLSQNGKSLLRKAKPKTCQPGGCLCSITSPLQAPAYLGELPSDSHHTQRCPPTPHPCPRGRFLHEEPIRASLQWLKHILTGSSQPQQP